MAKVARLVARPRKCYINGLERFIQRHIRNRSTNQIVGNSLFSSEIILKLDEDTELARAVDVMMALAQRMYILIIKVNTLFSFSSSRCFLKEIENMFSVFLSSYLLFAVNCLQVDPKKTRKCACFSLLRNLTTRLPLKFLPKLRKNNKKIAFRGRPDSDCTLNNFSTSAR